MDIVKHHNDINKIKLGTLSERELDLFLSLIFKMQEQKTKEVSIHFSELKELSRAKNRDNKRLVKSIDDMTDKLINLNRKYKMNGVTTKLNLFDTLVIDENNSIVKFKITETFNYMLNGLLKDFTYYSLKEFIELKSGYSKRMYKILKQFRGSNWYEANFEALKEILGVPESYQTRHFNERVLVPISKELSPIFKDLKIIKLTKDKKQVTRGKRIFYIRFEWSNTPNRVLKNPKKDIRALQTNFKVPRSAKELTSKEIKENKKKIKELQKKLFNK